MTDLPLSREDRNYERPEEAGTGTGTGTGTGEDRVFDLGYGQYYNDGERKEKDKGRE